MSSALTEVPAAASNLPIPTTPSSRSSTQSVVIIHADESDLSSQDTTVKKAASSPLQGSSSSGEATLDSTEDHPLPTSAYLVGPGAIASTGHRSASPLLASQTNGGAAVSAKESSHNKSGNRSQLFDTRKGTAFGADRDRPVTVAGSFGTGPITLKKIIDSREASAVASVSGESATEDYSLCGSKRKRGPRQILSCIIICMFIVAAILLAVLLQRSLHRAELNRFLDRQQSLCTERAQAFKTVVGQAVLSMQGAAGFGRLSQRMVSTDGVPSAPIGTNAHNFGLLNTTFAQDEADAFSGNTPVRPALRQTDFIDYFKYSASSRFLQQCVWMPKIFHADRATWENTFGYGIHNVNLQQFNATAPKPQPFWSRQTDKPVYYPWHFAFFTNPVAASFLGVDYSVVPTLMEDHDGSVSDGKVRFSFRGPNPAEVKPENIDQYGNKNYNIYVYLPVFATPTEEAASADSDLLLGGVQLAQATDPDARLLDAVGVVLGEIRSFSMLTSVLHTLAPYPMQVELYDRSPTPVNPWEMAFIARVNTLNDTQPEYAVSDFFTLSNRKYELRCTPTVEWVNSGYSSTPLVLSLGSAGIILINLVLIVALGFFWGWHRALVKGKELEEANYKRAEALVTLEHAQRVSDAANQSHELRNPLHAIGSMMEFLHTSESLRQRAHHEDLECLDTIDSQVKLMNVLVNDALDLSKIEAGKMAFECIAFSMSKLLRAIIAGLKSRAHAQGIAMKCSIAPDLARWTYGDPTRIRQVLTNLLSNAIKFTNVGEVIVTATSFPVDEWEGELPDVSILRPVRYSAKETSDHSRSDSKGSGKGSQKGSTNRRPDDSVEMVVMAGPRAQQSMMEHNRQSSENKIVVDAASELLGANAATHTTNMNGDAHGNGLRSKDLALHPYASSFVGFEIKVSDTGCGISEDNLPLLFQPFSQATLSVARKFGGTGLGLSIVKQIVELMGGSIQVTSTRYVGTTFIVRFLLPIERIRQDGSSTGTSGNSGGISSSSRSKQPSDESSHHSSPQAAHPHADFPYSDHALSSNATRKSSHSGVGRTSGGVSIAPGTGSVVSRRAPPRSNPVEPHLTPFTRNRALKRTSEADSDTDDEDEGMLGTRHAARPIHDNGTAMSNDTIARESEGFDPVMIPSPILSAAASPPLLPIFPYDVDAQMRMGNADSTGLFSPSIDWGQKSSNGDLKTTNRESHDRPMGSNNEISIDGPNMSSPTLLVSSSSSCAVSFSSSSSSSTSTLPVPSAPKVSVLVVDDSLTNIKILCRMLGSEGFECATALDGQLALDLIERKARGEDHASTHSSRQFHIIFSDILMPVMDGLQLAQRIRDHESAFNLPHVPLVALTANAMEHDKQACFQAGFSHFMPKPFSRAQLKRMVHSVQEAITAQSKKTLKPMETDQKEPTSSQ